MCTAQPKKEGDNVPKTKVAATLALGAAASLLAGCAAAAGGDDGDVLTYLESNWFNSLYPPAAGFYPNGGVVNQLTDLSLIHI